MDNQFLDITYDTASTLDKTKWVAGLVSSLAFLPGRGSVACNDLHIAVADRGKG